MTGAGVRRKLVGRVISNRPNKTALVLVQRLTKHRTYGKFVRRRAKYMVHDARNICNVGDIVKIIESRPISKRKKWRVLDVVGKANGET